MNHSIIFGNTSYNLNDGTLCYVSGMSGVGHVPHRRLESRGPQQHGVTDVGFRLDARTFNVIYAIEATSKSDLWLKRKTLLGYLRPRNTAVTLEFSLDSGTGFDEETDYLRRIDCNVLRAPWSLDSSRVELLARVGVQYRAADPSFYYPTNQAVVYAVGGGGGNEFDVPLTIPWYVGQSTLDQAKTVNYAGTWQSRPWIRIDGPITAAKIENLTTDEKLDFAGITIADGDYYEIDCAYGVATITDSNGNNKIADLSSDSDIGTFHLEPLVGGDAYMANDIKVTGTTVTSNTEVYLRYKLRYTGI